MKQNIYDNSNFFKEYNNMRNEKKGTSANDLIEIPTIRKMLPDLTNKTVLEFDILAIEDISKINKKFDLIISSLAIHYVADLEKALKDIYNLLNTNGYFIFSQEHPIGTGTILSAECSGKDNIKIGDKNYFLVSDYNINGKRIVDWNNCNVVKYHRNFSYIINTIIKCNFKIVEILEPIPNEEILNIKPKYKNQFDKPYFLFIKVVKN